MVTLKRKILKRLLAVLLVVACAFLLTPTFSELRRLGEWGLFFYFLWLVTFLLLVGSQVFWIGRILNLLPGKRRFWLWIAATALYVVFFVTYNFAPLTVFLTGHMIHASDARFYRTFIDGIFAVWLVGSFLGFGLVVSFWVLGRLIRGIGWIGHRGLEIRSATAARESNAVGVHSSTRRQLLRRLTVAVSLAPFPVAAYGLLCERLNVEITRQRVALAHLPNAFEGFRIAQLSDLHISSFMPAHEIRRVVALTNDLKSDLVVLTGDYLSWDPAAQEEVVQILAGLRARYGVLGCLGNHEVIMHAEESITRLFADTGIRILRQERASVESQGEMLNFIGVDDSQPDISPIEHLVMPNTVNILLVHNIGRDFDRAAEYGIDLVLMGHMHGGQLSLEFLHRGLSLARLETPYVSGWYEKSGCKLYVNRGIGSTAIPIRLGARPEITMFELVRGV